MLVVKTVIDVKPHVTYSAKIEVLRHYSNDKGDKNVSVIIDDKMVGECGYMDFSDCKYVDCSLQLDLNVKEFSSNSGKLSIKIVYENLSTKCSCDTKTLECTEHLNQENENGLELLALTRVTLFPKTHRSG